MCRENFPSKGRKLRGGPTFNNPGLVLPFIVNLIEDCKIWHESNVKDVLLNMPLRKNPL